MTAPLLLLLAALAPAAVLAQAAPPSRSPAPSATPSPLGEALGPNDPCTTLGAIVNRPTVTNSVCTVRRNHVEIETGYQNVSSSSGGGNTVTFPQAVVRVGTAIPRVELQVAPPQYERAPAGSGTASGLTDAGVGVRYFLGYTSKFSASTQAFVTAPTGNAVFSAGGTTTIYALQGALVLSPVFSLAAGLQDQILTSGDQRYGSFVPSLVLSAALPSNTSLFAEAAQFTHALGPATPTRTQYMAGVSRAIGQRAQIDVEYGWSPTVATGTYRYPGIGLSLYF